MAQSVEQHFFYFRQDCLVDPSHLKYVNKIITYQALFRIPITHHKLLLDMPLIPSSQPYPDQLLSNSVVPQNRAIERFQ